MADEPKTETPVTAAAQPAAPAAAAPPQAAAAVSPHESPTPVAAPAEPTVAATPTLMESSPDRTAEVKDIEPKHAEAKAAEAKAAETKPAEAAKPTEAKPAEAKVPEPKPEEKKAGAAAAEPAKPAPLDWGAIKYDLPQNITMDDAQRGEFQIALEKFRTDPAAAATEVLALGSKMMESAIKEYDAQTLRKHQQAFLSTRKQWATAVMADEELGGAGNRTAMGAIARVRDAAVPPERRAAFEEALRITGAGDHPEILRAFHRLAKFLDEPRAEEIPTDIKPPPNLGRDPGRRGARVLYDNPRSLNGRG